MRVDLSLFADYAQFYLQDEAADGNLSDAWNDDAYARNLAIAPGTVGVGTFRSVDVPVTVEVLSAAPPSDHAAFDLVTEASLDVPTGRVVVAGCSDYLPDARRIELPPGRYRVRVCSSGYATLSEDRMEGQDHYLVRLWRDDEAVRPRVLHDVRPAPVK